MTTHCSCRNIVVARIGVKSVERFSVDNICLTYYLLAILYHRSNRQWRQRNFHVIWDKCASQAPAMNFFWADGIPDVFNVIYLPPTLLYNLPTKVVNIRPCCAITSLSRTQQSVFRPTQHGNSLRHACHYQIRSYSHPWHWLKSKGLPTRTCGIAMGTTLSEPCIYDKLSESIDILRQSGYRYGMSEREIEKFIKQVLETNEPRREPPQFPFVRAAIKVQ